MAEPTPVQQGGQSQLSPLLDGFVQRLRDGGLVVATDVGEGEHRVDIAVADPRDRHRLLLAVDVDGPGYAGLASTRQRDRILVERLTDLGWAHLRLWAVDIFADPARQEAQVVRAVRDEPGTLGMVTTVSGLLTKPGLTVWSTDPGEGEPVVADLAGEATAATATKEVCGDAEGPARVATYTVTYDGSAPACAFVVADLDDGRRWVGTSDDRDLLARGVGDGPELVGAPVVLRGATCTLG